MAPKVVLVTGANTGIGYETVKAFLKSPNSYHVYLGSRTPEKGEKAIEKIRSELPDFTNTVEVVQIDVQSDESIQKAAETIEAKSGVLDVLINNAGGGYDTEFVTGKISFREAFNKAYDINVSGANMVTYVFAPLLLKSEQARVLFLAGMSQLTLAAENYFPTPELPAGLPKKVDFETIGYRCSKQALSLLMLDWAHKFKADGVKVFSVSPGFCATGLGGVDPAGYEAMGAVHPSEGGERLLRVAEGHRDADAGKNIEKVGFLPW